MTSLLILYAIIGLLITYVLAVLLDLVKTIKWYEIVFVAFFWPLVVILFFIKLCIDGKII